MIKPTLFKGEYTDGGTWYKIHGMENELLSKFNCHTYQSEPEPKEFERLRIKWNSCLVTRN